MKLLVLGGTVFLSHAVAAEAVARGHEVTCAARGVSGAVPDGAHLVALDRIDPDWSALDGEWDAVVDVARTPSWVDSATAALAPRTRHWTFVSSISVYADHATLGGTPETLALLPAAEGDIAQDSPEAYGSSKVACERLVAGRTGAALLVRPGLVVGPGDPSGRFGYWPERLAEGGEVLAPGNPESLVQVIDVRDLASWILTCAEQQTTGTFDAVGRTVTLGAMLAQIEAEVAAQEAAGTGSEMALTWVPEDFLTEHEVVPWAGPRSLPLWLPPEAAGLAAHDVEASFAAGLRTRPVAETAADTLAWLRTQAAPPRTGLTRAEEQTVLAAWHTIRA